VRREAARAVGGERAVKLLDDKNAFYKKYIDEEKNFNAKLVQKLGDTPEAIFNQMTSNNKVGASDAKRTMARLTGDERDAFRDALIRQKGGGDDFSIGKWAGEYKNMSDDAKNAFFMGKADLRKAHDNLMQGVEVYKDLGRFKNTSNTAVHSFANKLLTGGIGTGVGVGAGIIAGAGNVIGGVVLGGTMNKAFSELMSSPRATIALSNILKNPPATQAAFVSTLTKALKAAGMTDDEASDEIENLKQDALQPSTELPRGVISNPKQQPSVTIGNEPIDENGYYEQITPQSNTFTSPNSSFNTPTQREEGLRTSVYQDTTGNATIGYGFNLDSPSASKVWKTAKMPVNFNQAKRGEVDITAEEAQRLYDTSEQIATADARAFYPQFDELSKTQKEALVDMSYQLGLPRLKEFKGLRKALIQGNKAGIMKSLIESELHKQTPERNNRRISMLMN
jgi:GH24 family phage-related lysozyme (muramidase)